MLKTFLDIFDKLLERFATMSCSCCTKESCDCLDKAGGKKESDSQQENEHEEGEKGDDH